MLRVTEGLVLLNLRVFFFRVLEVDICLRVLSS